MLGMQPMLELEILMKKTYGGSGWGKHIRGEKILRPTQVHIGEVILNDSIQFHARNVARVTNVEADKIYALFVDPTNPKDKRMADDHEFCVWNHEMTGTMMRLYKIKGEDLKNPLRKRSILI